MSQYEQLIEYIINEQEDKARELFHQIVVGKSREIYESLMDEEDFGGNEVEELVGQVTGDEEGMDKDEAEFEIPGEESKEEENLEDRVLDLEDAMDEIEAKFNALAADEAGEPAHNDGVNDPEFMDAEKTDEEMFAEDSMEAEEEDADEELEESRQGRKMTEAEWIREYVEKIGEFPGEQAKPTGKMSGTGAKSEKQGEKNTKSIVAGKNDMGGTTKNIANGGTEVDPDGKQIEQPSNEYVKGRGNLKGAGQFKNTPGGNAGKSAYKTQEGSYENGGDGQGDATGKMAGTGKNSDKQGETNTKSPLKHIGK